jgi:hypothetical protein
VINPLRSPFDKDFLIDLQRAIDRDDLLDERNPTIRDRSTIPLVKSGAQSSEVIAGITRDTSPSHADVRD